MNSSKDPSISGGKTVVRTPKKAAAKPRPERFELSREITMPFKLIPGGPGL